ncbi:hypothetical protein ACHAWF_010226 [Thalassiosira exigua]
MTVASRLVAAAAASVALLGGVRGQLSPRLCPRDISHEREVGLRIFYDQALENIIGGGEAGVKSYLGRLIKGANDIYECEIGTHIDIVESEKTNMFDNILGISKSERAQAVIDAMRNSFRNQWQPNEALYFALLGGDFMADNDLGQSGQGGLCDSQQRGYAMTSRLDGDARNTGANMRMDLRKFLFELGTAFNGLRTGVFNDPTMDYCPRRGLDTEFWQCPNLSAGQRGTIMSTCDNLCGGGVQNIAKTYGGVYNGPSGQGGRFDLNNYNTPAMLGDFGFETQRQSLRMWDFVARASCTELRGPTNRPTRRPTREPTAEPTRNPTAEPTKKPTQQPTPKPTFRPTEPNETKHPTREPTKKPTEKPTKQPTKQPTKRPTKEPTIAPTFFPTEFPTEWPTYIPTPFVPIPERPTIAPVSPVQTHYPTYSPEASPTSSPTRRPTQKPTPTRRPTQRPTNKPTQRPSTKKPTPQPSRKPTEHPTYTRPSKSSKSKGGKKSGGKKGRRPPGGKKGSRPSHPKAGKAESHLHVESAHGIAFEEEAVAANETRAHTNETHAHEEVAAKNETHAYEQAVATNETHAQEGAEGSAAVSNATTGNASLNGTVAATATADEWHTEAEHHIYEDEGVATGADSSATSTSSTETESAVSASGVAEVLI